MTRFVHHRGLDGDGDSHMGDDAGWREHPGLPEAVALHGDPEHHSVRDSG